MFKTHFEKTGFAHPYELDYYENNIILSISVEHMSVEQYVHWTVCPLNSMSVGPYIRYTDCLLTEYLQSRITG